jgi:hypothetical protein
MNPRRALAILLHRHSWPLPKRPKSCEFDYGGSLFIGFFLSRQSVGLF